jgi:hypothetical protein
MIHCVAKVVLLSIITIMHKDIFSISHLNLNTMLNSTSVSCNSYSTKWKPCKIQVRQKIKMFKANSYLPYIQWRELIIPNSLYDYISQTHMMTVYTNTWWLSAYSVAQLAVVVNTMVMSATACTQGKRSGTQQMYLHVEAGTEHQWPSSFSISFTIMHRGIVWTNQKASRTLKRIKYLALLRNTVWSYSSQLVTSPAELLGFKCKPLSL